MSARTDILRSIDRAALPPLPRPELPGLSHPSGSINVFQGVLESIGGSLEQFSTIGELDQHFRHHSLYGPIIANRPHEVYLARQIEVRLQDVLTDENSVEPKEFQLSILPGEFCVEENGAVWVRPPSLRGRLALVSTEHLVLVVPHVIVASMHEAYSRIDLRSEVAGSFIAGPSKTADIEQNLVIGAQGARTLEVLVVGEPHRTSP